MGGMLHHETGLVYNYFAFKFAGLIIPLILLLVAKKNRLFFLVSEHPGSRETILNIYDASIFI